MKTARQTQSFMKQHDFVYERASVDWHHGMPLSNARLACMLWGDGKPLVLTLDRYDLWDVRRKPIDWTTYNYANLKRLLAEACETGDGSKVYDAFGADFETDWYHKAVKQSRLLPGRVEIELTGTPESFDARLDLHAAQSVGTIRTGKGSARFRCFVDAVRDVIVAEVTTAGGETVRRIASRASKADHSNLAYPPPEEGATGSVQWRLQRQTGGGEYTVAWTVVKSSHGGKNTHTMFCSIASSREQGGTVAEAVARLEEAARIGIARLFKEHAAWWAEYWAKSFITVPDPHIENLYYAQLYYLACLSREGAGFGQGCLGIWCPDDAFPGWANQHCYDMNYQMSSWCTFASNHLEMARPMAEDLWRWHPGRREFCRLFYGCEGATLNSGVDHDGWNVPGWYCADLWPGCGPWACHTLWNIYLYSQDIEFLRERAYPLMKDYMGQYKGLLEKWDDGKYHVPWSPSPEWQNNDAAAWGQDDSGNLALIRWLGGALLEAERVLGIESSESRTWRHILDNLAPFHHDLTGLQIMKDKPLDQSHRHFSHLLALYPLDVITVEGTDEDRRLIDLSLGNIVMRGMGAWCGYSVSWMAAMSARTRRARRAHALLKLFADIATIENAFHVNADACQKGFLHSPFIILTPEGGLAAAAALLEMLIQSWRGVIRIFPAVPPQWADAAFDHLRTEGAFLVSARRAEGTTTWVRIESEAGGKCRVSNPFLDSKGRPQPARLREERTGRERRLTGAEFTFATRAGDSFDLAPWEAKRPSSSLPRSRRNLQATNWYGLKKVPRF
jgi:alpha-L-fucosidase 2